MSLLLAFLTGLTTGGLSCLAVQGGLLASSLAAKIEQDIQARSPVNGGRRQRLRSGEALANAPTRLAAPILIFLLFKILAYTALGFFLGWAGQIFQLSVGLRAFIQILIGLFMLGAALRMLNVHPIFRYFAFEPPAFIRRKLRKTAANGDGGWIAPAILGAMTVLIPCGVTQAMMAVALAGGNPWNGAALMAAFTLGTSPLFFMVVYFAGQLGKKLEKRFNQVAAALILIIAILTVDGGLTLAGMPYSLTRMVNQIAPWSNPLPAGVAVSSQLPQSDGVNLSIQIKNNGYQPQVVHARSGEPVRLTLTSQDVYSCSLSFVIPSLGLQASLKPNDQVVLEIPAQPANSKLPFSCSMGMFTGTIVFDL